MSETLARRKTTLPLNQLIMSDSSDPQSLSPAGAQRQLQRGVYQCHSGGKGQVHRWVPLLSSHVHHQWHPAATVLQPRLPQLLSLKTTTTTVTATTPTMHHQRQRWMVPFGGLALALVREGTLTATARKRSPTKSVSGKTSRPLNRSS